jgi:hypothetical protein
MTHPILNRASVPHHYGIVFQPHPARDRAIREFLDEA